MPNNLKLLTSSVLTTGGIALWAGNCVDSETAIPQPGMAGTYGCPNRNSAK